MGNKNSGDELPSFLDGRITNQFLFMMFLI